MRKSFSYCNWMRSTLLLIGFIVWHCTLWSQTEYARFYADTERIDMMHRNNPEFKARLMEMTWRIHGQEMHWGSDTLRIAVDEVLDTLYFQLEKDRKWDTLICNIREPKAYVFQYNTCCNYFDVHDPRPGIKYHRILGKVSFRVRHGDKNVTYLGNVDDAGGLVQSNNAIVVEPYCRSAMFPNNYNVVISEVKDCTDSAACNQTVCLFEEGSSEPQYDFAFETVREFFHFRYLPLSVEPLVVVWDGRRKRVWIE
jgi:hypothetical protein